MAIRYIKYDVCKNCKQCYDICPTDVLAVEDGKVVIKYPDDCQSCALCVMVCPVGACMVDNLRPTPFPARR